MEYEDRLTIATPEGVDVNLTLAGAASRFVAAIIDMTIQLGLLIAIGVVFGAIGGIGVTSSGIAVGAWAVLSFLVIVGYDIFFEVRNSGRTPGKQLNGLRVVRMGGQPVSFLPSTIRNVIRPIDFFPGGYLVGAVTILVTKRNQRIGDLAAGTLVVRDRMTVIPALPTIPDNAGADAPWAGWDTSRITAEELAAVRQFLERRYDIDYESRARLATTLSARLRPKVTGVPGDVHGERFLERLAAAKLRVR